MYCMYVCKSIESSVFSVLVFAACTYKQLLMTFIQFLVCSTNYDCKAPRAVIGYVRSINIIIIIIRNRKKKSKVRTRNWSD